LIWSFVALKAAGLAAVGVAAAGGDVDEPGWASEVIAANATIDTMRNSFLNM
jgi:hypothetical protein